MNDLLFNVPWIIPVVLAVLGISLIVNGNKRQVANVRNMGAAVLLLAIGWSLLSYFVDTDKEKVDKQTHQLVKDVVSGDWTNFRSQLTPSAAFTTKGGSILTGAEPITAFARANAEMIHLTSATLNDLTVEQNGPLITCGFALVSFHDALAPVQKSSWQFDWERTSTGWKARELRLMNIGDVSADDLSRALQRNLPH